MKLFNRNSKDTPVRTELRVNLHPLQNPPEDVIDELPDICEEICPAQWNKRGRLVLLAIERNYPRNLRRKEKNFLTYRVDHLGYAHLCFYTHWEDRDMFTLSIVPDAHAKTPTYKLMSKQHKFVSLRHGRRGAPWLLEDRPEWEIIREPSSAGDFKRFVKNFVKDMMALPKRGNAAHHEYLVSDDGSWLR